MTSPRGADPASPTRRALSITIAGVIVLILAAALLSSKATPPGTPTFPPAGSTTSPAGAAAAATSVSIAGALADVGLQVEDVATPFRTAESARLATAPRMVIRAVLPADPDGGRIVIYEFLSTGDATVAAQEQAAYVASGIGRVQFPNDAQFTIRVVGSTVVFHAWSNGTAVDPARTRAVATALETLGFGVSAPN